MSLRHDNKPLSTSNEAAISSQDEDNLGSCSVSFVSNSFFVLVLEKEGHDGNEGKCHGLDAHRLKSIERHVI